MRKHLSQILANGSVDIKREYIRLYEMFYRTRPFYDREITINNFVAINFIKMPFRGTCVSLEDFNDFYGFNFVESPNDFDINYLVSFCEYAYNLTTCLKRMNNSIYQYASEKQYIELFIHQIDEVIEKIGYMPNKETNVTDFVEKNPSAVAVAEISDEKLGYKILEYNHHSLKGDLNEKKSILLAIYDKMASNEGKLKQINNTLAGNLSFIFNNLNLRHNNIDINSKDYKETTSKMQDSELEFWYDEAYQLCLLAILEVDNIDRSARIKELKNKY